MPGQVLMIPFAKYPALVELQDYLRGQLPEGSEFVDADSFHVTLVYMPDADADVVGIDAPAKLPVFGMGGFGLAQFDTPDGWAIHLRIENTVQLTYLQAALFYAVQAAGIVVGQHSWPGLYRPHVTLAYVPKIVDWHDEKYISLPNSVYLHVEKFILKRDTEALATWPLLTELAGARPVMEMATFREMMEWQFSGTVPDVPTSKEVNIAELTKGDENPVFVTLPSVRANATSDKQIYYGSDVVKEIMRQVVTERPTGIMGHLKDEDRSTKFPIPDVYWVGAALQNDLLWVKGYVPPGKVAEMLTKMKAANSKVALSIYGLANHTWDAKRGAWVASELSLEQIDIAPPKRSGLGMAMTPHITAEMSGNGKHEEVEKPMDKLEVINSLTPDDVKHLPKNVVSEIIKADGSQKVISEMRAALNIEESVNLVEYVTGLQKQVAEHQQVALESTIVAEIAKTVLPDAPAEDESVKSMRAIVSDLTKARLPKDAAAVPTIVKEVMESAAVKSQLERVVITEMGPNHKRRVADPNKGSADTGESNYFEIPGEKEKAES